MIAYKPLYAEYTSRHDVKIHILAQYFGILYLVDEPLTICPMTRIADNSKPHMLLLIHSDQTDAVAAMLVYSASCVRDGKCLRPNSSQCMSQTNHICPALFLYVNIIYVWRMKLLHNVFQISQAHEINKGPKLSIANKEIFFSKVICSHSVILNTVQNMVCVCDKF